MRSTSAAAVGALLAAASLLLLASACGSSDGEPTATATATPSSTPQPTETSSPEPTAPSTATGTATPGGFPIEVLFSRHPESDGDPAAVFPLDRVAPDAGVARFAIEQLIEGPSAREAAAGYFSTWADLGYGEDSDCAGERFAIAIEDGVATVRFCVAVMLLGVVADGQAQSALTATLEQFATIERVVILTREGDCMFDLSGLNRCLD